MELNFKCPICGEKFDPTLTDKEHCEMCDKKRKCECGKPLSENEKMMFGNTCKECNDRWVQSEEYIISPVELYPGTGY